ncbi:MAG: phage holin family protein [Actinomycetota bacterium]
MQVEPENETRVAAPTAAPPTPAADGDRGTGPLIRSIASDLSLLVTKQIELGKQELGEMVGARARAVGVFGAAAVLGLFAIGFLGWTGAEALDLVLPRWAAMLIVAAVFGILAAIAIVVARSSLRSSAANAALTKTTLKEDVRWAKQQLKR